MYDLDYCMYNIMNYNIMNYSTMNYTCLILKRVKASGLVNQYHVTGVTVYDSEKLTYTEDHVNEYS